MLGKNTVTQKPSFLHVYGQLTTDGLLYLRCKRNIKLFYILFNDSGTIILQLLNLNIEPSNFSRQYFMAIQAKIDKSDPNH